MNAKIRDAQLQKIPYMLVVGDKEAESGGGGGAPALRREPRPDVGRGVPRPRTRGRGRAALRAAPVARVPTFALPEGIFGLLRRPRTLRGLRHPAGAWDGAEMMPRSDGTREGLLQSAVWGPGQMRVLAAVRWLIVFGALAGMASAPTASSTPSRAPRLAVLPKGSSASGEAPSFLCSPQTQLRDPRRCPAAGPSSARAELARQGLNPLRPLPIARLDLDLGFLPFSYRQLDRDGTHLYASPEDAVAGAGGSGGIDAGLVWVSWSDCQVINDTAVYLTPGGYIRGGSDCKQSELPSFHGLAFSRTPSLHVCLDPWDDQRPDSPRDCRPDHGAAHPRQSRPDLRMGGG